MRVLLQLQKAPRAAGCVALAFLAAIALLASPQAVRGATVTVFAAASLTDSLKEIAAQYERKSGDRIVFNFASSGALARQIEAGAPADVFFSADEARMDQLDRKGLIVTRTRQDRLSNRLVLVTLADGPPGLATLQDLASPSVKRLALGDPKTVPAGTYAKAALERKGLWSALEKKVVPCESVRAVLGAVESGNVDAGIVYRTDAAISTKVRTILEVTNAPPIRYPLAVLQEARQPAAAARFHEYLRETAAGAVFMRRGFVIVPSPEKR